MRSLGKILAHILLIGIIIDISKSPQPSFAKPLPPEARFSSSAYYAFTAQGWPRFGLGLYVFLAPQPSFAKPLPIEARFSSSTYYAFIAQGWPPFGLGLYVLKRWEQLRSHGCTSESRRSRVALTGCVYCYLRALAAEGAGDASTKC